jgi:hypothetical protein
MKDEAVPVAASLYEQDETAWLEQTAALVEQGRWDEIDRESLCEFLWDMARRDKREVFSRLVVLLTHLLKWEHQPGHRSHSWRGTIVAQRQELAQLLESGALRRHASEVFSKAYAQAIERAAAETGVAGDVFPAHCTLTLEEVLQAELAS